MKVVSMYAVLAHGREKGGSLGFGQNAGPSDIEEISLMDISVAFGADYGATYERSLGSGHRKPFRITGLAQTVKRTHSPVNRTSPHALCLINP
jgi:hypothetical protein